MFDCDCEECGAPATRTVRGIFLCDACEHGGEDPEETPHWAKEIPAGLLDDEDGDGDEDGYPQGHSPSYE